MVRRYDDPHLTRLPTTTRTHRVASCEKGPMRTHQCPYCHDNFTPSRYRPDQGVCSGAKLTVFKRNIL